MFFLFLNLDKQALILLAYLIMVLDQLLILILL